MFNILKMLNGSHGCISHFHLKFLKVYLALSPNHTTIIITTMSTITTASSLPSPNLPLLCLLPPPLHPSPPSFFFFHLSNKDCLSSPIPQTGSNLKSFSHPNV